jgi:acetoin utilization deacetylase AcuC-like enzyme
VIDFDVHHGNGTQEIFAADPRVLYVSSHLYPFYPGTGALPDVGTGRGRGFTVNLPLAAGMGDAEYARVYRDLVEPVGKAFAPDLVLVSAGFDAYEGDPLADMALTPRGYSELTRACLSIAGASASGRAVFVLEGGYALEGLATCGAAVVRGLLGDAAPEVPPAGAPMDGLIEACRSALAPHWPVLAAPAPPSHGQP